MMRALAATLSASALALAAAGAPALAQDSAPIAMEVETAPGLDGTISIPTDATQVAPRIAAGRAITEAAFRAGFSGEVAIDMGGLLMVRAVSPDLAAQGHGKIDSPALLWPFASVTKQILAAKMVDELDAGDLSLDAPVSGFVSGFDADDGPVPTIRQLLQHRSGLRDPDATPEDAGGWPEFYSKPGDQGLEWCLKGRAAPPAQGWSYNNCDYIVLGAAFDEVAFERWQDLLAETGEARGRRFAVTSETAGLLAGIDEPESRVIAGYGASAALAGNLENLLFFNWDRMKRYESDRAASGARAAFWQGDPALGFMALGHWVFEVTHPACPAPITVSQRKGGIGRYALENIMLPELGRSMVFASASAPFEFGEIWAKDGFLYEAVGTLACGDQS